MPKKPNHPRRDIAAANNTDPAASHLKALRDLSNGNFTAMDHDDRVHYDKFCAGIVACLKPLNEPETQLAQSIASDYWRLNRVRALEESMFALGQREGDGAPGITETFLAKQADFKLLSQCEMRVQRSLDRNKADLKNLQSDRALSGSEPDHSSLN